MEKSLILLVLIPFVSSFVSFAIGMINERFRNLFLFLVLCVEAYITYKFHRMIKYGGSVDVFINDVMGTGMVFKLDMFRYVFVLITVFAFFMATVYSFSYLTRYEHRNRYYLFFMLTFSGTIGMFISENIINMFTFFESFIVKSN